MEEQEIYGKLFNVIPFNLYYYEYTILINAPDDVDVTYFTYSNIPFYYISITGAK